MAANAGIIAAVASIATAATSAGVGVSQHQAAAKGRQRQSNAQSAAAASAAEQQRKADEAFAAANRRSPDIGSLLTAEQQGRLNGPAGTLLTSPEGVKKKPLLGGGASLLGV